MWAEAGTATCGPPNGSWHRVLCTVSPSNSPKGCKCRGDKNRRAGCFTEGPNGRRTTESWLGPATQDAESTSALKTRTVRHGTTNS